MGQRIWYCLALESGRCCRYVKQVQSVVWTVIPGLQGKRER
jgi:hypothetical protein